MTIRDRWGNPVSTTNKEALAKYEEAAELLHGFYLDPIAAADAALALQPDFVMAHALKAGLLTTAVEKAAEPVARAAVEAAEALWLVANERERGHIQAARAWLEGDFDRALSRWARVAIDHPHDLVALQFAHQTDLLLGRTAMLRERPAAMLAAWPEGKPGRGYILGMHAFGLEETGAYAEAEAAGQRALAENARDPWAVHALAHVYEMTGRHADGIALLERRAGDWAADNMLAYHNWWHLALYHLDLGEPERAIEILDARIRPKPSEAALEMVDASALLWRLHLRGVDVGARWAELAECWAKRLDDGYYAFLDAHAIMAMLGAGRVADAERAIAAMARAAAGTGTNAMMSRDVGLPLGRGLLAFAKGDYAGAVEHLLPVREVAIRFGGSHAQRDIVGLTLVEAALRARDGRLAAALAAERVAAKPTSPFNWRLAERAHEALGEAGAARSAGTRARALAVADARRRAAA